MHGYFCPTTARRVRADRELEAQLRALAGGFGQMVFHEQKAWSSITFAGARHRMTWVFDGIEEVLGGEQLVAHLDDDDLDLTIPAHLVADAAVVRMTRTNPVQPLLVIELELLLLEEG